MRNTENPLKKYLREAGVSQAAFALILTESRGHSCTPAQISHWCAGRHQPSYAARREIEKATKKKVPVLAWDSHGYSNGE